MIQNIFNNQGKNRDSLMRIYFEVGLQFRYYYFVDLWSLTKHSYLDLGELE